MTDGIVVNLYTDVPEAVYTLGIEDMYEEDDQI